MEFKEQIQRILENVPKVYEAGSSSIKNEVSNALKGSASGEVVALKDVSPLEHNLKVKISGVDNPEAVKLLTYGGNLLDVSKTGDTSGNNYETYDKETNTITAHRVNYNAWEKLNIVTPLLPRGTYTMFKGKEYRSEVQLFNKNLEPLTQYPNDDLSSRIVITATEPVYLKMKYFLGVTYPYTASATDFKLVAGDVSEADYEPYKEPIEYAQGEDIKSIAPCTTIMTDTEGAVVEVEYNRDLNKAFAELYQAIISLGGNV